MTAILATVALASALPAASASNAAPLREQPGSTSAVHFNKLGRPYVRSSFVVSDSQLGVDTAAPGAIPAGDAPPNYPNRAYVSNVRANNRKRTIGPSYSTGYGVTQINYFTQVDSTHWRVRMTYTYEDPTIARDAKIKPVMPKAKPDGFCFGLGFGSHCWNQPWTWDWGSIFDNVGAVGHMWWSNIHACLNGDEKVLLGSMGLNTASRGLVWAGVGDGEEWEAAVGKSPYAFAFSLVAGCSWSYYPHPVP